MCEKIRVAVIGIGHSHADAVVNELLDYRQDLFEIVGYYENDQSVLNQKKDRLPYSKLQLLDVDKILNGEYGLDGIVIESTMEELLTHAQKCLKLNIPIHMDKPAGTDLSAFEEFLSEAEEKGIPVQMGYMYRYNPAVYKCKEYIADGKIGTIYGIEAQMSTELSDGQRQLCRNYTGGCMYVYGCHLLDLVLQLQGEPKTVAAYINCTNFEGITVDDCTMAVLDYGIGTSFVRTTGVEANGYGRRQLVVCGSKGTIEIRPMENPVRLTYAARDGQNIYGVKAVEIPLGEMANKRRFEDMMIDFANIIKKWKGQPYDNIIFPVDYEYEKKVHRILLCASGIEKNF